MRPRSSFPTRLSEDGQREKGAPKNHGASPDRYSAALRSRRGAWAIDTMNDLIQIIKETDEWALSRLAVPRLAELVQADRVSAEYWIRTHRGFLRSSHEKFAHGWHWSDLMSRSDAELERGGVPSPNYL